MKSIRLSLRLRALALCVSAVIVVGAAQARTIPAVAGSPASLTSNSPAASKDDFAWVQLGLAAPFATTADPRTWVVPVALDTGGMKSFVVWASGRSFGHPEDMHPAIGLTCTIRQLGTVNSSTPIATSVPGTQPTTVQVNVTAGNTVVISCTFTDSGDRLLFVEHTL